MVATFALVVGFAVALAVKGLVRTGLAGSVRWTAFAALAIGLYRAWERGGGALNQLNADVLNLGPMIALGVGLVALSRSPEPRALALAGGLVLGAPSEPWAHVLAFALVASGLTLGDTRVWPRTRDMLTTVAAATLAGLCLSGLCCDLSCSLPSQPYALSYYVFGPAPAWLLVLRSALETTTLLASLALLRGRTVGAITLGPSAFALAYVAEHTRGPVWGGGCLSSASTLSESGITVLAPTLLALAPWSVPLLRALATIARRPDAGEHR